MVLYNPSTTGLYYPLYTLNNTFFHGSFKEKELHQNLQMLFQRRTSYRCQVEVGSLSHYLQGF